MKKLRIAGLVVGAVFLLLAVFAAFVASRFDGPRLKAEAAKAMMESRQRTLKVDGELSLSIFPRLGLKIDGLSLSERNSPEVFARVASARVSVALLPLLARRVEIGEVAVDGVEAAIVRRRDGSLNIDDLLAQDKQDSTPLELNIAAAKLGKSRLTWRDERTGDTTTIDTLEFSTGRLRAHTGKGSLDAEAVSLAAAGTADGERFELRLTAPRLSLAPESVAADAVTLSARLAGTDRKLDAQLVFNGIGGTPRAFKVAAIAFSATGQTGEAGLKAEVRTALDASLDRRSATLERIGGSLEIAHPRMPMKTLRLPLDGSAKVDLAKSAADLRLASRFDDTTLDLDLHAYRFSPLGLRFKLGVDRLDLDRYLPSRTGSSDKPKGKADTSPPSKLDLDGIVTIGSLKIAGIAITNLKLKVQSTPGGLSVMPQGAALPAGLPGLSGATTKAVETARSAGKAARDKLPPKLGRLLGN